MVFARARFKSRIKQAKHLEIGFGDRDPGLQPHFRIYKRSLEEAVGLAQEFLPRPPTVAHRALRALRSARRRHRGERPRPFERQAASEAYQTLVREGQLSDCELFPVSGTLLGLIREGDFLKHDYDLDFGVLNESDASAFSVFLGRLAKRAEVLEVKLVFVSPALRLLNPELDGVSALPVKTKIIFASGIVADIFTHFRSGESCYHGSTKNLWRNTIFSLEKGVKLARGASLPADPERYLAENYGDWKTPKLDYVFFLDTPNWEPVVSADALKSFVRQGAVLSGNRPHQCARVCSETLPRFLARLEAIEARLPS